MSGSLAKPSYQPWNEEDFQSDVFVRVMNPVQKWMYRTLLQASFFHTTRPYLPNDDRILWVLAGCESKQQWEDNKTEVLDRFKQVDGRPELLENNRVNKDWRKLQEFRDKMSDLGHKSAAARARSTHVEPSLNSRQLVIDIVKEKEIEIVKEENDMALADKLRNEIYERTGKVPKLSDWLVAEFRKRVGTEKEKLAAFREYLNSNPESEYPLHEFLDSDIADQFTKPTVVSGVIANPALVSLASKVFTISDYAVSGKSLTAAENLLKVYPELDIINAFRYFYGKLDDFGRKQAVRDFFEKGAAEPVILAMKEYQQHQEDVIKRAEAVPVAPVSTKPEVDDGEEIDF